MSGSCLVCRSLESFYFESRPSVAWRLEVELPHASCVVCFSLTSASVCLCLAFSLDARHMEVRGGAPSC